MTRCVFPGIAGMLMRGQHEELQLICEGEWGRRGFSRNWQGELQRAQLLAQTRGSMGRAQKHFGGLITFQLILLSPASPRPWQELHELSGGFLLMTVGGFSVSALQALSTDDSPSNTNLIVQVMFDERAAVLNSSASKQSGQQQTPCKRRSPGDPRKSAGAHGTANAGHT